MIGSYSWGFYSWSLPSWEWITSLFDTGYLKGFQANRETKTAGTVDVSTRPEEKPRPRKGKINKQYRIGHHSQ